MSPLLRFAYFAFVLLLAFPVTGKAQSMGKVEGLHHDITVYLNPDTRSLKVTDRITFTGESLLNIRLSKHLYVTALLLDGGPVNAMAKSGEMLIRLSEERKSHEVLIEYNGQIPGLPSDIQTDKPPVFFTDPAGSFLPGSSGWIADLGVDLFTYKATLFTPALHKAIVPGRLVEEETNARRYKAVFEAKEPSDDIPLFAGPYKVEESDHKGIKLRTYFTPGMEGLAADYLAKTAEYIDLYSQWIGPYPFAGFSIIASPLPVGYGYPGLTYMGANVLRLPFIKHTSLGHEVLHNWWGNGVFTDYGSGNWAEGLTTFMADYAYALKRGPEKAKERRLAWLRDYAALPPERDAPARSFISKGHTASQVIGYHKVAFFFHMLRNRLGDDTFDKAIQHFWKTNKFSRASWKELRTSFELASGQSLGNIFTQWLDRKGAPALSLIEAHSDGKGVIVALQQSKPTYELNLPIVIETSEGERHKIFKRFKSETATLRLPTKAKPVSISIDPDFDLFRRLAEGEAPPILRDVTLAENALVVVTAPDPKTKETARRLAVRMMDLNPRIIAAGKELDSKAPHLIIGTDETTTPYLARAGLGGPPSQIAEKGSARAWAGKTNDGVSYVVVTAKDNESLKAVLRPLPHYGRTGYIAFKGSKAIAKGAQPAASTALKTIFP